MYRRASLAAVAAIALGGCPYHGRGFDEDAGVVDGRRADGPEIDAAIDGPPADAPVDGRADAAPDARLCDLWSPQHVDACALPPPGASWHLTAGLYTYDTTSGTLSPGPSPTSAVIAQRDLNAPQVRVISVDAFTMDTGAVILVSGTHPLVIASWSTITTSGTIDAGSHIGGTTGAGVDPGGLCNAATAGQDGLSSGGSGGGGGGGMRGAGGGGGQGDNPPGPLGGPGGAAIGTPTFVRGGCSGADSGTAGSGAGPPSNPSTVSSRGAGGGAIELIARTTITLTGAAVLAGGAGGGGAPQNSACGGGGGGAGGFVGLDAPAISVVGSVLAANGGGGGASAPFAGSGNSGGDGGPNGNQASGGAAQTCAPAGGNGGAGGSFGGATATGNGACGGGGGGGATGFVLIWSPGFTTTSSTISPPQIVM